MDQCTLCETRKARRHCPGVRSTICTQCCGTEREVTVDCPLDCEHLIEARLHERAPALDPSQVPHRDIEVSDGFLHRNDRLLGFVARSLLDSTLATPGAVDQDVREALDALIRTYRTLDSGLIYETRPANPYAATIQQRLQAALHSYREQVHQSTGIHSIRDAEVLGVIVFLLRVAWQNDNRRRRGRAFLSFLREMFPPEDAPLVSL